MAKIIGGTTATSMLIPDWNQKNPNRADYIKNKPDVANALKGNASGAAVVMTDVSPVEHEIKVKLARTDATAPYYKYDFNGDGVVNKDDATYLLYHAQFPDNAEFAIPWWASSDVDGNGIVDMDDSVALSEMIENGDSSAFDVANVFEGVTLTKHGINLFNPNWQMIKSKVLDATTGLPKDWAASWCITDFLPIEENGFIVGQAYTASRTFGVENYPICLYDEDKNFISSHQARYHYSNETAVFTIPENCRYIRMSILVAGMNDAMVVLGNYPTTPELNEACPFEPYKNAEVYSANEDGTVNGVIGKGENMTLSTDTAGVTIEAEYNRDINKAFAELLAKIGG